MIKIDSATVVALNDLPNRPEVKENKDCKEEQWKELLKHTAKPSAGSTHLDAGKRHER